ncbi:DNA polymerase III subunit delta' [Thermotalea metallivorans]|uniref:DNA polymerase III subunit delta' n=1 Tax=Thermotalea metallivorans TaxID=520762 RepID=A0A140L0T8_9FIRM|nr:DNA polymerase III subunit delta' [Thermotalea metallivorans]KXG74163.1 DNA polymerase III subunit gamma/tau [Thermotalea metallivorans]
MGFHEIIGQDKIVQHLKSAILYNRIAHAYIFDGPEGIGKKMTALAFAKAVVCKQGQGDACHICPSCIKFQRNNHPDIRVIEPEGNSIKNKQIEDFQQDILIKPYESNKKVYIVKDAHDMTVSAQNRILKTLEEPPAYAVIVFTTTNANSLLPTIRSRCQILKFHRIGQPRIEAFLMRKYGMEEGEARVFSAFSDGIVGKAMKLKESEVFKVRREETIDIIDAVLEREVVEIFQLIDFFEKYKEDIDEILDFMLVWFRDMLMLKETGTDMVLINLDKRNILQKHLYRIGYEKTSHIIEIIEKTKRDLKANVNFQLAMEMLLLNIREV